ncbi:MAG: HD domain-containing protein [Planctomycetia bacterium]|nr:HD domain-containing protein [Planctomycetia bacterium]
MKLTSVFTKALIFAADLHKDQYRKGEPIPYLSHLLRVSGNAIEFGADEETAIAALLHDAVEDQGGMKTADRIRSEFGDRVCDLVLACSDSTTAKEEEKLPWKDRKEDYIRRMKTESPDAQLISACDKLDNLTCTARGFRKSGIDHFARFYGAREGKSPQHGRQNLAWYYRELIAIFRIHYPDIAAELDRLWEETFLDEEK